jgi:MYXO-CTERM domain-containing protein
MDCTPYTCTGNVCQSSCSSIKDCVAGYICSSDVCVLPLALRDAEGCAVEAGGGESDGSRLSFGWLVGVVTAIGLGRRRRRLSRLGPSGPFSR